MPCLIIHNYLAESSDIRLNASLARQGCGADGERLALEPFLLVAERFKLTIADTVYALRMLPATRTGPSSGDEPLTRCSQCIFKH